MLNMRLNQTDYPPSLSLATQFIEANNLLLVRMQDKLFEQAPKFNQDGNKYTLEFYRFKASQFALDGKVDNGEGDTIFSQLIKGL